MSETPSYPKRPRFFALRFCRVMAKDCLANEIGPEACWLLTVIAHTEDAKGYRAAVTFFNEQLMPLVGLKNVKALDRIRDKAVASGWLHYEAGGKSKAGRYWVLVPDRNRDWDDHPTDEHEANARASGSDYSGAISTQEAGENRQRSGQQSGTQVGNKAGENRQRSGQHSSLALDLAQESPPNPPQPGGGEQSAAPGEETLAAIAEVTGLDPATAERKLRPAAAALARANPPYTPAEVREFGRRFTSLCPYAVQQQRDRPTPKELAEKIGLIRAGPKKRAPPGGAGKGAGIIEARQREAEEAARVAADLERNGVVKLGSLFDRPPEGQQAKPTE